MFLAEGKGISQKLAILCIVVTDSDIDIINNNNNNNNNDLIAFPLSGYSMLQMNNKLSLIN